jgi:hypothetical protein
MTSASLRERIEPVDPGQCRRRLISFRLTDEEYEALQSLTAQHGAHSLSDFVRSRVCSILTSRQAWEDDLAEAMKNFARQAVGFHASVEQLGQLLGEAHRNRTGAQ